MRRTLDGEKNVHFVGIGGIGMSAIAKILLERGCRVSGSDLVLNNLTADLESRGARIFEGHAAGNLPADTDEVVYSSAVSDNNPEILKAKERGITVAHRASLLGELLNEKKGIAVTGTHGKTTTASFISVMMAKAGLDPTVAVGGEIGYFGSNARSGCGEWMVAEADESDGSFLRLKPFYAVITNMEMEHVDYIDSPKRLIEIYTSFIRNIKKGGALFYHLDDENIKRAIGKYRGRLEAYSLSKNAGIYPRGIRMDRFETSYRCVYRGKELGEVRLRIPGAHNVLNSLAAVSVGLSAGIGFDDVRSFIRDFHGAKRRFQLRAKAGGALIIEDYAHHPTEIRAVIEAARGWNPKRLIVVFQPHRFTRTKYLADAFGGCFKGADKLILTDIYAASEEPIKGVSVEKIYTKAKEAGQRDIVMLKKEDVSDHIYDNMRRGDMVLVLGAGDIKDVANELSEKFRHPKKRGWRLRAKGKVRYKEALAPHTTFRIGGPADILVEPKGVEDLKRVLALIKDRRIPAVIIGRGSNILVHDEGFRGAVIRLSSESFKGCDIEKGRVRVGAGLELSRLIKACCAAGLEGLESLVGIPGTVGGAIFMNAGGGRNPAYRNMGEFVESVTAMDFDGEVRKFSKDELVFGCRSSNLSGYMVLEALLKFGKMGRDPQALAKVCGNFLKIKRSKQVLDAPSAGCVFKNSAGSQFTSGQLIDMLGLKGRRAGGAEISPKHANFIVNRGGATFRDVMGLIELIRTEVRRNYGINLELEVKIV